MNALLAGCISDQITYLHKIKRPPPAYLFFCNVFGVQNEIQSWVLREEEFREGEDIYKKENVKKDIQELMIYLQFLKGGD